MRAARFRVHVDLLRQALHMPASSVITHARMDEFGCVELTATDPSLPEADEPHNTEPIITKRDTKWDWGLADEDSE